MTFPRIAIVGFAHSPNVAVTHGTTNGVEMLRPCFDKLYAQLGITRTDIEFWCSGSSDYLAGRAFSFISAVDSIGAMPPINESHVEMDAAWALYEAWSRSPPVRWIWRWPTGSASRPPAIPIAPSPRRPTRTRWRRCGRTPAARRFAGPRRNRFGCVDGGRHGRCRRLHLRWGRRGTARRRLCGRSASRTRHRAVRRRCGCGDHRQ